MLKSPLKIPDKDSYDLYNDVINIKRSNNKQILENIKSDVFGQYKNYEENKCDLENIPDSIITDTEQKKLLKNCYTRDIKTIVGKLTNEIISNQNVPYVSNCPHCGFETSPDTIDHYIPKELFPEYSILPINLIPMCSRCNTIKGTNWIDGNTRTSINYYFDEFTNHKFLYGMLKKTIDTYIVLFELKKPTEISEIKYEIIKNHYKTFDLNNRYSKASATILSQMILKIKDTDLPNEIFKNTIEADIKVNNTIYGPNYWKTCILEAILNDDDFWK